MNFLVSLGFTRTTSDSSRFILHEEHPIYLIVYVDDIIVTSPDHVHLDMLVQNLAQRYALKDLGTLSYFLGVEVIPTADGYFPKPT